MTLGERIKIQRLRLGWSRDALAANAGVSEPTIYRLETDAATPNMKKFEQIISVLGGEIEVKFNAERSQDHG